jgi:EAL domain-containing protein (putative c-di-GMP-specific phosphodiesterase class I)
VVLELPEDTVIESYDRTKAHIDRLVNRGYRIAMDDLARGRIDLWYLVRLRPSIIKIDLSMIRDVDVDTSKQSLVSGLKLLGEVLRADVVAEGIEREGELEHLRQLGVQFGQGYLLGRPGPLAPSAPARQDNHRHPALRGRLSGVRG